jgi:hypothetical protein
MEGLYKKSKIPDHTVSVLILTSVIQIGNVYGVFIKFTKSLKCTQCNRIGMKQLDSLLHCDFQKQSQDKI